MKKILIFVGLSVFLGGPLCGQSNDNKHAEEAAIRQAAMDYIEGWYSGNPGRMERALHPDLVKRGLFVNPESGKTRMRPVGAETMVEYTKKGVGKKPEDQWGIEVSIQDVYKNTASVKIVSVDFIDYAHIGKFDGEWKIINVLWEPIGK